jgi:hypothetical protein
VKSFCPSIILRLDEITFLQTLSTMEFSPALLKQLRKTVISRKKKRPGWLVLQM